MHQCPRKLHSKRLDVSPFTICKELGAYIAVGVALALFSPQILVTPVSKRFSPCPHEIWDVAPLGQKFPGLGE